MTEFWIIAAVAANNVIGRGNALPWRIPEDLARFKALTLGSTLVMGRKTFESIGRPLPGRTTLVLTRRADFAAPGVLVAHSPEEAVSSVRGPHAFVAGGAGVYELFLPLATKLFLTRVHAEYAGDTFFPRFDAEDWELASAERGTSSGVAPSFTFEVYERRSPEKSSQKRP
jgi:dihydrofolate reductase